MKFNPRYSIWEAASDDESRPVLTCVYFDVEQATLSASDSYILAEVPCVVEAGDISGLIPAIALRKAAAAALGSFTNRDAQVVVADGYATFTGKHGEEQRWPLVDGTFPFSTVAVAALFERNTATVDEPFGMNHRLFGCITRAMGYNDRGNTSVRLHQTGPRSAVYVEGADGARGLIMPVDLREMNS